MQRHIPAPARKPGRTTAAARVALAALALWLAGSLQIALAAEGDQVTLNLKDASIQALIDTVADATGRNFVVDPRVKGQVTVVSSRPMGRKELYNVFQSILNVHGFAAVESGEVTKIVPDTSAKQLDTPVDTAGGREDILTRVVTVKNVPAAQMVPILRPLMPQQGHLAAYPPTNVLIVSDRAGNVNRIVNIIGRIDRASDSRVEVVSLDHASAEEVVRILTKLEKQTQGGQGGNEGTGRLTFVADKRTNSVLVSGDEQARLRLRAIIAHLDTPLESGGNTHVIYLRYAKAEDLVPVLEGVVGSIESGQEEQGGGSGGQAGETSIQADESTNALVINAPTDVYRSLRSVVDSLDVRRAQVLVEAIIAEISATRAADLGLQWAFDGTAGGGDDGPIGLTSFGGSGNNIIQLANSPESIGEGLSLGVGDFRNGDFRFGVLLRALASDAGTNILSTPSIVTLDNAEAEIVVGQNVPFVTGQFTDTGTGGGGQGSQVNPFQTIERQDVGITLQVTPQINEGNAVQLEIAQEVSSLAPSTTPGASDLITQKRSIKTSVLVEDGQLVILGGLVDDDVQESVTKVPGLGDIPILGNLFKFRSTDKTKRNLMVFLHPVIMRNQELASNIASGKYSYMRAEQLERREEGVNLMPREDTPLLPPEEEIRELPPPFGERSPARPTAARAPDEGGARVGPREPESEPLPRGEELEGLPSPFMPGDGATPSGNGGGDAGSEGGE